VHPRHPFLSTKGHSIGHWEGKTLVVDTCCFRADTPLPDYGPHSDAMHITERVWSPRPGELMDHMVVTDPKAFTHPWATTFTYYHRPNWEEVEDDTSQNDRPRYERPAIPCRVISPNDAERLRPVSNFRRSPVAQPEAASPISGHCSFPVNSTDRAFGRHAGVIRIWRMQ
jgi:hypothetical protein